MPNTKPSQADNLVSLAGAAELFHDEMRDPYARVHVSDHYEIWRVKSKGFRRWLFKRHWDVYGKAAHPNALISAISVIEGKAVFEGARATLHNRVAWQDGAVWIDLADERWRAVRVSSDGWEIIDQPPILFRRYPHQSSLPEPDPNGDARKILDFANISDDQNRLLLLTYLVSCLIPDIPHPVLILHGSQGAAKTTLLRMMRSLIDPSEVLDLTVPSDVREMVQILSHNYVCAFDNVTYLPTWASDLLCRAVTGGGFSKRELFSDDEDVICRFKRCITLNGINAAATKPDLLDRSLLVELERIDQKKRLPEAELWEHYSTMAPAIFGGMLDVLSKALAALPNIKLEKHARMADFTLYGCAIAIGMGLAKEEFLCAYEANLGIQNEEAIREHAVASAIVVFMDHRSEWSGSPSELLGELNSIATAENMDQRERSWPKGANWLTKRVKEAKSNLATAGISITISKRGGRREITLCKSKENTVPADPFSEDGGSGGKAGITGTSNTSVDDENDPLRVCQKYLDPQCRYVDEPDRASS